MASRLALKSIHGHLQIDDMESDICEEYLTVPQVFPQTVDCVDGFASELDYSRWVHVVFGLDLVDQEGGIDFVEVLF